MHANTLKRMEEVTGGQFKATFDLEQVTKSAAYNLKYVTTPMVELVDQYNKLVDDSQHEID